MQITLSEARSIGMQGHRFIYVIKKIYFAAKLINKPRSTLRFSLKLEKGEIMYDFIYKCDMVYDT